jgi:transcriptional regulator with XRE-family HTH domain
MGSDTVQLHELIARRRGAASLQDLADATGMSKQTWATHARPPTAAEGNRRVPDEDTILRISQGLNVDTTEIMLSIGETMGVIPPNRARPRLLSLLPPWEVLERLTPEDEDAVVRLIALLAAGAGHRTRQQPAGERATVLSARSRIARAPQARTGGSGSGSSGGGEPGAPVPAVV